MKIEIMTLFPEMCENVLSESIIGRARKSEIIDINCINIRDFAGNKHNRVDDAPYGGGKGMVMQADPIYNCFKSLCETQKKPHLIYMSPKGKTFKQEDAVRLSQLEHIVLLCGHYEGVDQRVIDEIVDEEISVGDYVLTGGELPALIVADAVARMIPGVLSEEICFTEESHFSGLLEYDMHSLFSQTARIPASYRSFPLMGLFYPESHKVARQAVKPALQLISEALPAPGKWKGSASKPLSSVRWRCRSSKTGYSAPQHTSCGSALLFRSAYIRRSGSPPYNRTDPPESQARSLSQWRFPSRYAA